MFSPSPPKQPAKRLACVQHPTQGNVSGIPITIP